MLIKLQNEDKLYDIVTDDAIEGEDYELGEFDCPYANECKYNSGEMINKCIGMINMVGKHCLLESVVDSDPIIPKDSPIYKEKGQISFSLYPVANVEPIQI